MTREKDTNGIKTLPGIFKQSNGFLQSIDGPIFAVLNSLMQNSAARSSDHDVKVVGSFGNGASLANSSPEEVLGLCDIAEIRLDLLLAEGISPAETPWKHLQGVPLLFTARCKDEGGAMDLDSNQRAHLLRPCLENAALVDIEAASISSMSGLIRNLKARGIPWIASFHNFLKLPSNEELQRAAELARISGAAIFKAAAMLHTPADLARLAEFQLVDHGVPVATMGMGPLAPVSRLLCAQCGSVLNYGYLGTAPTAPGQWDSELLKLAISRSDRFRM